MHRETTGVEIWDDCGGNVDVFVSAVGTGGTITGVGELLKSRKPEVRIVAVEPAGAAVLSGRRAGSHQIPGIGVGFIPTVLDRALLAVASRPNAEGTVIVVLLADTAERYITAPLFASAVCRPVS